MGKRRNILDAVMTILNDSALFKVVRDTPTNIKKERSLPIAWINLSNEVFPEDSLNCTRVFRYLNLEIMIGCKQDIHEDKLNDLIDDTFDLLQPNYSLNNTVINMKPTSIITDEGLLHPYAMASLNFKLQMR